MENIILIILLILALGLIALVLFQRSEGGGLGIGGGGGNGQGGRPKASPLSKVTWVFGAGFMIACLALTVISAQKAKQDSVVERVGTTSTDSNEATPAPSGLGDDLLPPSPTDAPAAPPKEE